MSHLKNLAQVAMVFSVQSQTPEKMPRRRIMRYLIMYTVKSGGATSGGDSGQGVCHSLLYCHCSLPPPLQLGPASATCHCSIQLEK